jgi:hypothetical protein
MNGMTISSAPAFNPELRLRLRVINDLMACS